MDLLKISVCIFLLTKENLLASSPAISFLFLIGFALGRSKFSSMFREIERWEELESLGESFPLDGSFFCKEKHVKFSEILCMNLCTVKLKSSYLNIAMVKMVFH